MIAESGTRVIGGYYVHYAEENDKVSRITVVAASRKARRPEISVALCDITEMLHPGWWVVISTMTYDAWYYHERWFDAVQDLTKRAPHLDDLPDMRYPGEFFTEYDRVDHGVRFQVLQVQPE